MQQHSFSMRKKLRINEWISCIPFKKNSFLLCKILNVFKSITNNCITIRDKFNSNGKYHLHQQQQQYNLFHIFVLLFPNNEREKDEEVNHWIHSDPVSKWQHKSQLSMVWRIWDNTQTHTHTFRHKNRNKYHQHLIYNA